MTINNVKSFTLIELMVVISITGMIAGLILSNMRSGGDVMELNSDAEKLSGIIKQAQMMALSGKQISGSRPSGGYGIYFNPTSTPDSYKLFADTYLPDDHEYTAGQDTIIQSFNLTKNVEIDGITSSYNYIIFVPPMGIIYVGTTGGSGSLLTSASDFLISLKHAITRYAYAEINAQGQIDVRKTP